jgi:NAD(P)-dependent dehydrogenase (short-subunit alcohol dehydrogenase family)
MERRAGEKTMKRQSLLAFCVILLGIALIPAPAVAKGELVAVAGASGRTGKHVVEQLAASGYQVRALVRDMDKAKGMFPAGVTIVAADVRDIASLRPALKGARYVVSAIGAGGTGQIEGGARQAVCARVVVSGDQARRLSRCVHASDSVCQT